MYDIFVCLPLIFSGFKATIAVILICCILGFVTFSVCICKGKNSIIILYSVCIVSTFYIIIYMPIKLIIICI